MQSLKLMWALCQCQVEFFHQFINWANLLEQTLLHIILAHTARTPGYLPICNTTFLVEHPLLCSPVDATACEAIMHETSYSICQDI